MNISAEFADIIPHNLRTLQIKLKSITEFMWLIYPKATFLTLRGSLRPLRRVAARALEHFAFCAITLRFTSFIFGACVRRAPSELASAASVIKKKIASNSHFRKHPQFAAAINQTPRAPANDLRHQGQSGL